MVTRIIFILWPLFLSASTLAASLERVKLDDSAVYDTSSYPDQPNSDDLNELPVFVERVPRGVTGGYAGASSYGGVNGGVPYGGGGYNVGTYGPSGYVGYASNYGPSIPNFPVPNFYPLPYGVANPYDVNSLFNMYFNALQNYHQSLQNQLVQLSNTPAVSTRQITLGPLRPPTLPLQPIQPAQLAQMVNNARQQLQRALCQALQRLQVSWAETSSVCSGQNTGAPFGGQGLFAFAAGSGTPGGDTQISVSAPPGAVVQPIHGPDGNVQGVSVSHQGPSGAGTGFVGTFSSSSSSSSNVNGEGQSHHASTTGVHNNGQTTIISSQHQNP